MPKWPALSRSLWPTVVVVWKNGLGYMERRARLRPIKPARTHARVSVFLDHPVSLGSVGRSLFPAQVLLLVSFFLSFFETRPVKAAAPKAKAATPPYLPRNSPPSAYAHSSLGEMWRRKTRTSTTILGNRFQKGGEDKGRKRAFWIGLTLQKERQKEKERKKSLFLSLPSF